MRSDALVGLVGKREKAREIKRDKDRQPDRQTDKQREREFPLPGETYANYFLSMTPGDVKASPCASPLTAEEEVLPDEELVEDLQEDLVSTEAASTEAEVHVEPMLTEEPVEEHEIAFIVDI